MHYYSDVKGKSEEGKLALELVFPLRVVCKDIQFAKTIEEQLILNGLTVCKEKCLGIDQAGGLKAWKPACEGHYRFTEMSGNETVVLVLPLDAGARQAEAGTNGSNLTGNLQRCSCCSHSIP